MYFYLPLLAYRSCSPTVISAESYLGKHLPPCRVLPAVLWIGWWGGLWQDRSCRLLGSQGRSARKQIPLQFPWATSQAALNLNLVAAPTDSVAFLDFSYYRNTCIICISAFVCLCLFQVFLGELNCGVYLLRNLETGSRHSVL